jgi:trans-2,3-dihydro-3-hydroxyanthranilate isomerase
VTRSLHYRRLDVFTDRRFGGNPLAIVEAADGLETEELQAIAREFNLSETVFLLEPRNPVHSARARIFTPRRELPFAGHPTIGAAAHLAETRAAEILGRSGVVVVLETELGALRCEVLRGRGGVTYAEVALPIIPERHGDAPDSAALAAALGLAPADIGFGDHAPTMHAAGPRFLFVPLRSREAVERARRAQGFETLMDPVDGVYLYTRETIDPASAIHARMLAHGLGFDEDPATGSAAAAFAAVALAFERPDDGAHELFIEQGYAMGRPSRITLRLDVEQQALTRVAIGGQVAPVGEGRLFR